MSIIIELPNALERQIASSGISLQQLEEMIVQFVKAYLAERESGADAPGSPIDGGEFAAQIISRNRALFEELARR